MRSSRPFPKSSTGGGSLPGLPVRRLTKACCSEVKSRRASASVAAAKTLQPEHQVGRGESRRGTEGGAVDLDRLLHQARREMRGEGVGEPERRRELGAEEARAEHPDLDVGALAGNGADAGALAGRLEIVEELDHVLREAVDVAGERAAERPRRRHVGAGGAAEAEVDAPGMEGGERAEGFRHHQRRVVGEHDAAGADADRRRAGGDMGDHHRGRGAGDAGHVVMLGEPVAAIAETLRMAGEVEGVAERRAGVTALGDGREVEDGEGDHRAFLIAVRVTYQTSIGCPPCAKCGSVRRSPL